MFNIILIISGLLEYILLGIDFHVSLCAPVYPLRLSTLPPAG